MRRAASLTSLLAVLLVSCGGGDGDTGPAPTPQPTPSQASITFGYPAEPPTLDPLAPGGGSAATRDLLRPMLPALFGLDASLRPVPELVAAWPAPDEITSDPFTVTLTLRDADWSDGRPITSEDVRFSHELLREGPNGYRYRFLESVEIIDARRFRFIFDRPMRRWWALFSIDDMVLPAHAYAEDWARGPTVSGGPFVFGEWVKGLRVRLERNDAHWARPAVAKHIDVVFVPDGETRLQLLERDELDVAFFEGESNVGERAAARGWDATEGSITGGDASGAWGPTWWELGFDIGAVGADVAAAVAAAIDPELVGEILEDSGEATDTIPARFPSSDTSGAWSGRGDLEAARGRLEEAGYRMSGDVLVSPQGRRVTFQLAYPRLGAAGGLARFVHFRLRELGIRVELVGLDAGPFVRDWVGSFRAPALLRIRRGADAPDVGSYASGPGGHRDAGDAIDRAESTLPASSGRPVVGLSPADWANASQALAETGAVVPLARIRSWVVASGAVSGPQALGALDGPLWNAADWRPEPL